MTIAPADRGAAAVLLDIEGTAAPLAFVHDTLFPFARARLRTFLGERWGDADVQAAVGSLEREHEADAALHALPAWSRTPDAVETYARWLMDRDRKSPGLKQLQGWIWEQGYRAGELKSELFSDVAPAIRRWRASGLEVAIYSSGSALAQRLLFGNTPDGDLTALISAFFDTSVGPKRSPESYQRIARALGLRPPQILFISDVVEELDAARAASLQVALSVRPGNPSQPDAGDFEPIESLDELH